MADAQLVLSPLVRVTDANNQPIAGGELRFYEAGTSTPLVVYADSDLLVALGSTVNTDDGGYPISGGSAKTLIWTGPDEYKVVVHDADGVPLVTHDNIRGALVVPEAAEASYPKTPVITRTTTTVISTDYESYRGRLINANPGGGSFVITLPSAVTVEDGFRIGVRHAGTSNTVTIRTIGTQTIGTIGQAALKSFALTGLGNTVWLVSNGADWIVDTEVPALINNSYFIVADRLTSPPGSPVAGTRYIINGTPAGAWSTLGFDEDDIAESDGNGSWFRYAPRDGYLAYVTDENMLTQWRDSEWVDLSNIVAPNTSTLQYAVFEHRLSNGTNGGTATTGAWTNRTLNTTVVNSITGASLGSNAITLPVGKYLVLAQQSFFSRENFNSSVGGRFVAQQRISTGTAVLASASLYGVAGTVGTTLSVGSATGNGDATYSPTDMFLLDVTTAGTITLQYYTTNSQANTALGIASAEPAGEPETYARVTVLSLTSLQGPQGIQGSQGNAATIAVGTVTTVDPGDPATVTNSGSSGAAVFDFNIPKGEPGQNGGQGASGGAVLAYFEWNTATSGDPGSGGVLANNATLASATEVNISKTGPNGEDYSAFLASWAVSTAPLKGHLRINTAADLSEFIDADVTGFTDNSTYVTIALTNVTGAGAPSASDTMSVVFMRSGDLGSISVPDYTALKALPPTGAAIVTDPNRGGTFVWRTGDYSALVAIDTAESIYVASGSDTDGDTGCWVRQGYTYVDVRWAGAVSTLDSDQAPAIQAAINIAQELNVPVLLGSRANYRLDSGLTMKHGQSDTDTRRYHARMIGNYASLFPDTTGVAAISIVPRCLAADSGTGRGIADISIRDIRFNGFLNSGSRALKIGAVGYACDNFRASRLDNLLSEALTSTDTFEFVRTRKVNSSGLTCRGGQVSFKAIESGAFCGDMLFDGLEITGSTASKPGLRLIASAASGNPEVRGIRFIAPQFYGSGYELAAGISGSVGDIWFVAPQWDGPGSPAGEPGIVISNSGPGATQIYGIHFVHPYISGYTDAALSVNAAQLGDIRGIYLDNPQIGTITTDGAGWNAAVVFSNVTAFSVSNAYFGFVTQGASDAAYVRCYGCSDFTIDGVKARNGSSMSRGVQVDGGSSSYRVTRIDTDATVQVIDTSAHSDRHVLMNAGEPYLIGSEGTGTPTVVGTSTAGTGTYSLQQLVWWRIGKLVHFRLNVSWTAHTGTGDIRINATGMPACAVSTPVSILYDGLTYSSPPQAFINSGASTIDVVSAASNAGLTGIAIEAAAGLRIAGSYLTA